VGKGVNKKAGQRGWKQEFHPLSYFFNAQIRTRRNAGRKERKGQEK